MGVAVGDYDGDGFPDLYLTQYGRGVLYRNEGNGQFTEVTEKAGVAAPGWSSSAGYNPAPSWLFHNNGDGTFTDVSKQSGIAQHLGKAWGVVATDIDNDGRMDLFVSNAVAKS